MKKLLLLLASFSLLVFASNAQTAKLQIIHNSPSPTVDIWVNGVKLLEDVAFRTATAYLDVPADVNLNIGVALETSTMPSDIIASFDVTLSENSVNVAIASGLVGNMDTPFTLVTAGGQESAAGTGVDFLVNHGATDAPAVDVIARGVATLVNGAAYGDVTSYINVPAGAYTLDVTPAGMNETIVASYTADLSGLEGGAAVVFASGFLAPPTMADPAFGLFAALPDGTVVEFPAITNTARLQVIHNSAAPTVDIYVNDALFLGDFAYRTATPYVDVPAGTNLNIGVAPAPSNGPGDVIADFNVILAPDSKTIAIASGLVGSMNTPFTLVTTGGQEAAAGTGVDFLVNHGATDAPAVDVIARGITTLVDGAAYGDVTSYINVPAGAYTLDVTPDGTNETIVASYTADLTGLEGGAAVVFASGFLSPPTMADPAFGLFAALPDGTVVEFPAITNTARLQVIHNSASPTVDIYVNDALFLEDFAYRTATPFVDVPAGTNLNIGVAPAPSNGPADVIADFDVTLAPDSKTIALAGGLVGSTETPFTLFLKTDAQEAAAGTGVDLVVHHGSTDAPAVDVIARNVGPLVDGASYGDITNYFNVPANAYILDITPDSDNSTIVASFVADLSSLEGGAAMVFASGFLSPTGQDPAFGLFATLPDGTTFPLSVSTSLKPKLPIVEVAIFPNPTSNIANVSLTLDETSELALEIIDAQGRIISTRNGLLANSNEKENWQIDVSTFSEGIYFVRLKSNTASSIHKMMVRR